MFTGIIEKTGKIAKVSPLKGGKEIIIESELAQSLEIDDSVSINGTCHTVVACDGSLFTIQSVEETLRKTTMGSLSSGMMVNLEDSLTMQKKLDGHVVQGHVDTTGVITNIEEEGSNWLLTIDFPENFSAYLVPRGSIAVDGISLTIARLSLSSFVIAIIPYTWNHTNLHERSVGDKVNLEFDVLGKYVLRAIEVGLIKPQ
jgi:riboflavin synthase